MDALEAIKSRRVQRAFARTLVEPEKLSQIVSAGRHAMSARNLQPWQFIVLRDRSTLDEVGSSVLDWKIRRRCARRDRGAQGYCQRPLGRYRLRAGRAKYGDRGMGARFGHLLDREISTAPSSLEMLGVPVGWAIFTILPFGYPDAANPPQARPLKSREEMVHYERYGNRSSK